MKDKTCMLCDETYKDAEMDTLTTHFLYSCAILDQIRKEYAPRIPTHMSKCKLDEYQFTKRDILPFIKKTTLWLLAAALMEWPHLWTPKPQTLPPNESPVITSELLRSDLMRDDV